MEWQYFGLWFVQGLLVVHDHGQVRTPHQVLAHPYDPIHFDNVHFYDFSCNFKCKIWVKNKTWQFIKMLLEVTLLGFCFLMNMRSAWKDEIEQSWDAFNVCVVDQIIRSYKVFSSGARSGRYTILSSGRLRWYGPGGLGRIRRTLNSHCYPSAWNIRSCQTSESIITSRKSNICMFPPQK